MNRLQARLSPLDPLNSNPGTDWARRVSHQTRWIVTLRGTFSFIYLFIFLLINIFLRLFTYGLLWTAQANEGAGDLKPQPFGPCRPFSAVFIEAKVMNNMWAISQQSAMGTKPQLLGGVLTRKLRNLRVFTPVHWPHGLSYAPPCEYNNNKLT